MEEQERSGLAEAGELEGWSDAPEERDAGAGPEEDWERPDAETVWRQETVRRDVQAFLRDYPEVRAGEIPEEVWADMHANGVSLSAAYGKHQVRALQKQMAAAGPYRRSAGSLMGSLPLDNSADPAFAGWED